MTPEIHTKASQVADNIAGRHSDMYSDPTQDIKAALLAFYEMGRKESEIEIERLKNKPCVHDLAKAYLRGENLE